LIKALLMAKQLDLRWRSEATEVQPRNVPARQICQGERHHRYNPQGYQAKANRLKEI
jgi:hypothetical protein